MKKRRNYQATEAIKEILTRLKPFGVRRGNTLLTSGRKIIFKNERSFLRGIWVKGFRAFHLESTYSPGGPYWLSLNLWPWGMSGRFILYLTEHPHALEEGRNRHIHLSREEIRYKGNRF